MFDNNPRLIVFAGPNGSGKSTITRLIDKHKILPKLYVNPDDIARELNPENSWEARIAAGRKAVALRKSYLDEKKSFAMETTLSGVSELTFIKDAISKGYKVTAIYVATCDGFDNIARVKARIEQGGHRVPSKDILRRRERSLKNLSFLINILPRVIVMDNTHIIKTILKKNNDKITYVSDELPNWFLSNASEK